MGSNSHTSSTSASGWSALAEDIRMWLADHIFAIIVTGVFVIANILRWVWHAIDHSSGGTPDLSLSFMSMGRTWTPLHASHTPSGTHIGFTEQFVRLVESLLFVRTPLMLVFCAIVMLFAIGFAQSRVGMLRTVVLIVVNAVFGTALGLLICAGINSHQADWARLQHIPVALTPVTVIVGIVMACSAFEGVMWRRRIVLLVYTFAATALLFNGNPGDYCTLVIALIGHGAGLAMHAYDVRTKHTAKPVGAPQTPATTSDEDMTDTKTITDDDTASVVSLPTDPQNSQRRTHWWSGTDYEVRRLFAAIQLVFAIGPVIALTSRAHAGLLTGMGLFMSTGIDDTLLGSCENNSVTTSCIVLAGVHRMALFGLWTRILLPIAALIAVAWGLYRGRRLAAVVGVLFNMLTVAFAVADYLVSPFTITLSDAATNRHYALTAAFMLIAVPPLILAISLWANLAHFPIRTARRPVRRGLAAIVGAGLLTGLAYLGFGLSHPESFIPRANTENLMLDFLRRLLPIGFAGNVHGLLRSRSEFTTVICSLLVSLLWAIILVVFLLWFRDRVEEGEEGRKHANQLVLAGGESMSFMTTWEGNQYWFTDDGRCAISYRVSHGVALTVTGPFGDPQEYDRALSEFMRFCYKHSWSPAFYAVHDQTRHELELLGCSSIHVGTEMVVIPSTWQTRGKKWQDIRTAINKAKREGITDVLTTFDHAGWQIQQQIIDISEQWASLKALPEMKFTLGGLEELRDSRVAVLYAVDGQGLVQGVTSWLPTYRDGRVIGWTLDFMRHRTDSPNGIMEFLIARMAERLRDEGREDPQHAVEFMSLSAAPLAGMGRDGQGTADTEVIEHALQIVADYIEPAYGFKSLYFFKRKFQPQTAPVYLCYPDAARLAQIGLSVLSAYVPELKPSQVVDMLKSMRTDTKPQA